MKIIPFQLNNTDKAAVCVAIAYCQLNLYWSTVSIPCGIILSFLFVQLIVMDDNKKDEKLTEGAGRLPSDKQDDQSLQQKANRDISEMDRQEGSMNNGTLGGNFDEPDKNSGDQ